MTASFGDERKLPPDGWAKDGADWRCLNCRREEVLDEVQEQKGSAADLSKRRRRALTEFELRRDPAAPDHLVAKRVRCATHFVGPVREELGMEPVVTK
jgi:hypothetical protein